MSIIEKTTTETLSENAKRAGRVVDTTSAMADTLISLWHSGWDTIWSAPDPSAVLSELGVNASEVFELNEQTVAFLSAVLTNRRQEDIDKILSKVAIKPPTTVHADGTVTIN